MGKFNYIKFQKKLKAARSQFLIKTKKGLYFINIQDYPPHNYNEEGFVARFEANGQFEVILFDEVQEIIVDSEHNYFGGLKIFLFF